MPFYNDIEQHWRHSDIAMFIVSLFFRTTFNTQLKYEPNWNTMFVFRLHLSFILFIFNPLDVHCIILLVLQSEPIAITGIGVVVWAYFIHSPLLARCYVSSFLSFWYFLCHRHCFYFQIEIPINRFERCFIYGFCSTMITNMFTPTHTHTD